MNEIEKLERELRSICPAKPSESFTNSVERALGESAKLAVRQHPDVPDESSVPAVRINFFASRGIFLLGAAALIAVFLVLRFAGPTSSTKEEPATTNLAEPVEPIISPRLTDDSPINGISRSELSLISEPGWETPQALEIPLNFFDEGIVERPGMSPARRYRYDYMDETTWRNAETNTLIRSSVPRQEILLIGIEPF